MDKTQNFELELENIVPEYHSKNPAVRGLFIERWNAAIAYLREIGAKSILDAGCGNGRFANRLKNEERFEKVVAIDYNSHVSELNGRYKGITFSHADLNNPDIYIYI